MPAVFSAAMGNWTFFFLRWSHSAALIQQKSSKMKIFCGYIFRLAEKHCPAVLSIWSARAAGLWVKFPVQFVPFGRKRKHSLQKHERQPGRARQRHIGHFQIRRRAETLFEKTADSSLSVVVETESLKDETNSCLTEANPPWWACFFFFFFLSCLCAGDQFSACCLIVWNIQSILVVHPPWWASFICFIK